MGTGCISGGTGLEKRYGSSIEAFDWLAEKLLVSKLRLWESKIEILLVTQYIDMYFFVILHVYEAY